MSSRKQKGNIYSASSAQLTTPADVLHGSVLRPLLFLIYVNGVSENLLSLTRLFTDDSSLFFSASNPRDIEGILNHDLALNLSWAKVWLVDFNPVKTEALLFNLKPVEYLPSLNFNDTEIKFVESHEHLGVTFTHNGQWHTHTDNIVKSANKQWV